MRWREAVASDVPALAELAGELGYPSSVERVADRLRRLLEHPALHGVFVIEDEDGAPVGWIHVFASLRLESEPFAEIGGLVVGAANRGGGVGEVLVRRAEDWARERGYSRLRVRSSVVRERAHRFYERLGFTRLKEQVVLVEELTEEPIESRAAAQP